jgi:hypothetical protein
MFVINTSSGLVKVINDPFLFLNHPFSLWHMLRASLMRGSRICRYKSGKGELDTGPGSGGAATVVEVLEVWGGVPGADDSRGMESTL